MLKKGMIITLIGGLWVFGLAGCGDDSTPGGVCGDGIVNGDEECDLSELGNNTCADVLPESHGTLKCADDCTFDTSECAVCGDGQKTLGEQCDCGTDPQNLPAGCTDVNGGSEANCSESCQKLAYCGDGQIDQGEECDCGTDPQNLPVGCDDVNGGANANCADDCTTAIQCSVPDPWGDCDPNAVQDCCADNWDVQMECTGLATDVAVCLRPCSSTDECYWSNSCFDQLGVCYPAICSMPGSNWPNQDVGPMEQCQIPGGGPAVCITFSTWRTDNQGNPDPSQGPAGVCVGEADTTNGKAHGETCTVWNDSLSVDRSEMDMCLYGDCLPETQGATTGTCVQFCSWEAEYDYAFNGGPEPTFIKCPAGTNCLGIETIDPDSGLTGGDFGRCFEPVSDTVPADQGITACDLVTGKLLRDPSITCADDTHFQNGVCALLLVDSQTNEVTNGSLIGACMDGPTGFTTVLNAWDSCDPNSTDTICPAQTTCLPADAFAASPSMGNVCVPYCDTEHTDCVQHIADMGGPSTFSATPVCTSESMAYPPYGPQDVAASRVGLCAVPTN